MSMPKISDINPTITIKREDAVNIIIASIAMEELALAHILNAEGEKLQYVLGTLVGRNPGEIKLCDIMAVNKSIQRTLRDVIKTEMLLQFKMEDAASLIENENDECRMSITAKITWRDGDNVTGIRPPSVIINLLRDDEIYDNATVDTANGNTHTFTCLLAEDKFGDKYTYQVNLSEEPKGYTKTVNGFNIIYTIEPGLTTISGSKIWVDNNNEKGDRPTSITVNLLRNGAPSSSKPVAIPAGINTVEFSFPDEPKFDNEGNLFDYTVDENQLVNYTKNITGFNITNTHTP